MNLKHVNGLHGLNRPDAASAPAGPNPGSPAQREKEPRETLNLRFLAWLALGCTLFGIAWYGVHRWQVRRNAALLLEQADVAEAEKRLDRAARFVGLYVGLVPGDPEARARYGLLLERLADSPRARYAAMAVFEQVLIRDPDRHDIRRRLAVIAADLGKFDDAEQHLAALRRELPADGEVQELSGRVYEARGEYGKAAKHYRAALVAAPGCVGPYLRLAYLLRDRLARPADADKTLAKLVDVNRKSVDAYLGRARFLQGETASAGALQAARRDIAKAFQLAPDKAEVLLAAADLAVKLPEGAREARRHLRRFLKCYPKDVRGYQALARVETATRKPRAAVETVRLGLKKLPDHPVLLWSLANLLIEQQEQLNEVEGIIAQLTKVDFPPAFLNYLRAALLLRRGDWPGALTSLEAVRPLLGDSPELMIKCNLLLAECYERRGDREAQIQVYRRAIALAPLQPGLRLGLTAALLEQGQIDQALDECQRLMAVPNPPALGWALLAQLKIRQNLRLPLGQRQWQEVEAILDRAAQVAPDSSEGALLRVQFLVAQKQMQEAHQVLERARKTHPRKGELWIASTDLAVRDGKPELAQRILKDAERKLEDGASLRLARLRFLVDREPAKVDKSLPALEVGLEKLPEEDRVLVLGALAETHYQARRTGKARRLWNAIVRLRPNGLGTRLRLFELAMQSKDAAGMREELAAIKRLEGEEGLWGSYHEARYLIWLGERGDKGGLSKARAKLNAVEKRHPEWSVVPLCLGQILELEGNSKQALEKYTLAIELGARQLDLVRRVVLHLYDQGRYPEAESVLRKLPEQDLVYGDLQRIVAEIAFRKGNYSHALDLARRPVRANSRDHRDYIWLAQVLWAAAQHETSPGQRRAAEDEAERHLNRAVELANSAPETWVALVQHLARTGRLEKAESVIEKARRQLPPKQAPLALAECYVAISRLDKARELYAAAVKASPDDLAVLRMAVNFYLRVNDRTKAEQCLRKVIASRNRDSDAASWAGPLLAVMLAAEGKSREALELIRQPIQKSNSDATEIGNVYRERAQAVVLALRPGRVQHRQAIDILERLSARQHLLPEDRFLLVQLYERVGDYQRAFARIMPLLQSGNPRYLAHHVNSLLGKGLVTEAEKWLVDLEKLEPKSLRTISLKARILKAQNKGRQAAPLLLPLAVGKDPETKLLVAALLEEVGCGKDAETLYREYLAVTKRPDAVFPLAVCLARRHGLDEALNLCDGAWNTCPPRATAEASLAVLHATSPSADQYDRVEGRLKDAIRRHGRAPELILCLAKLHEERGRYQAAKDLYGEVLEKNPRNALALNNLAWILALREGRSEEALAHVNDAVNILGSMPELLDTRAVAYLAAGKIDSARADLEDALAQPFLKPEVRFSIAFHLAQTYYRAGNQAKARKFWQEAHAQGIRAESLHGLEQGGYKKLVAELGPR